MTDPAWNPPPQSWPRMRNGAHDLWGGLEINEVFAKWIEMIGPSALGDIRDNTKRKLIDYPEFESAGRVVAAKLNVNLNDLTHVSGLVLAAQIDVAQPIVGAEAQSMALAGRKRDEAVAYCQRHHLPFLRPKEANMTQQNRRLVTIVTPTGPMNVIRPVAQKLLDEGLISGDLNDTVVHAADAAIVKAAVMAGAGVCDFCASPSAPHTLVVPDFLMPNGTMSIEGWAACDECNVLVEAGKRKALLDRSLNHAAFPKFSRQAIAELHARFWNAMDEAGKALAIATALGNYVEDRLPDRVPVGTSRDVRLQAAINLSGLTRAEVELVALGDDKQLSPELLAKLAAWGKRLGTTNPQIIRDMIGGVRPPTLLAPVPHWQRALDAKFEAAAFLHKLVAKIDRDHSEYFPEAVDLNDAAAVRVLVERAEQRKKYKLLHYHEDLRIMPTAQAYSFSAETAAAIQEAAQSIPHDAPLSSIEAPNTGSGWFWFQNPLPIVGSPAASDHIHALLWSWTTRKSYRLTLTDQHQSRLGPHNLATLRALTEPNGGVISEEDHATIGRILRTAGITQREFDEMVEVEDQNLASMMFSVYVLDERGSVQKNALLPSTRWHWPFPLTFHEMIAFNARSHRSMYGPGAPLADDPNLVGEETTLKCVADVSLFFLMACLWFRQTVPGQPKKRVDPVLTQTPGHIERHARKRYQREHKLPEVPTVHVVALRKTARTPSEDAPVERAVGARNYQCRWIVKGHPRLQPCGPGRKDRKLIWIEAHPAGPEDKPLRTKTTVYAVIR